MRRVTLENTVCSDSRADLHGDNATWRQPGAPAKEDVTTQRAARHHPPLGIDRVDLQHSLGQIGTDAHDFPGDTASCNLLHGLPPSMA
jgi:hypothetical protein